MATFTFSNIANEVIPNGESITMWADSDANNAKILRAELRKFKFIDYSIEECPSVIQSFGINNDIYNLVQR